MNYFQFLVLSSKTNKDITTEIFPPLFFKPTDICARAMPGAKKGQQKVRVITLLCNNPTINIKYALFFRARTRRQLLAATWPTTRMLPRPTDRRGEKLCAAKQRGGLVGVRAFARQPPLMLPPSQAAGMRMWPLERGHRGDHRIPRPPTRWPGGEVCAASSGQPRCGGQVLPGGRPMWARYGSAALSGRDPILSNMQDYRV